MMDVMIKRALGISAMALTVGSGSAVTWAPHAAANTDCGTSGNGATVSAGPDTSCAEALKTANTPIGNFSEVDVTDSTTGQTQAVTPASANRQSLSDEEMVYKLCRGGGTVITHPSLPDKVSIVCDNGLTIEHH